MGDKENDRENERTTAISRRRTLRGQGRIVIDGDKDATDKVTKTMTRSKRGTTRYVPLSQYCARTNLIYLCLKVNR